MREANCDTQTEAIETFGQSHRGMLRVNYPLDDGQTKAATAPYGMTGKCPVLTRMVHPSRLKGWCALRCGLLSQLLAG